MKFALLDSVTYWWPVSVRTPDTANPGKMIDQRLKVLFQPQDQDVAVAQHEKSLALKTAKEFAEHEYDGLTAIVMNWDDVVDAKGGAIPFSPETFRAACQKSAFRAAVWAAYHESQNGQEARLGN